MTSIDINAEREKIQREIEALERSLGPNIASIEVAVSDSSFDSDEDDLDIDDHLNEDLEEEEEDWEDGGSTAEMCLQMNLVYQAVIEEKIQEVELLIAQNKEQQDELMWEIAGRKYHKPGDKLQPLNLSIGHFLKPYFKDKSMGMGPPANHDMLDRTAQGIKSYEVFATPKWTSTHQADLKQAVISDSLQRMLQPKLLKLEYLEKKFDETKDSVQKKMVAKQIQEAEREIADINQLSEDSLLGQRTDDHDWEKISNLTYGGLHTAERLKNMWQNYEHPGISKNEWDGEEIKKLLDVAQKHNYVNWKVIAQELGSNRTAFQCLQKYQSCNTNFKRKEFSKEEDEMLTQLVQRMRVGNHIPYKRISYFMEARDSMQILYRWSKSLDPAIKKGHWTKSEDELLLKGIAKHGAKNWYKIQNEVPGRSDVQCRERYIKGLDEDLKKGKWSPEEKQKLMDLTEKYGVGHWAKVAKELTHRTGSQCLSKWKGLMGYFKSKRKKKAKKLKIRKTVVKEENKTHDSEDSTSTISSSSSDEDELELIDSEEEKKVRRLPEPSFKITPCMNKWIPRRQIMTASGKALIKPSTFAASCSKQSQLKKSKPGKERSFQFTTLLKGIAYPHSMDRVLENRQEILKEPGVQGRQLLLVEEDEVRKVLQKNSDRFQDKLLSRINIKNLKSGDLSGIVNFSQQELKRERRVELYRNSVDRKLLLAVTPWVGDVLLSVFTSQGRTFRKGTQGEILKQKLKSLALNSTPIFSFLIQIFRIDADGCLKIIRDRRMKQIFPDTSRNTVKRIPPAPTPAPAISTSKFVPIQPSKTPRRPIIEKPRAPPPKPKTVMELLREKRMRESNAKKTAQNTVVLSSNLLLPQSIVINPQPNALGNQQTVVLPLAPSTPEKGVWPIMPFVSIQAGQIPPKSSATVNPVQSSPPKSASEPVAANVLPSTPEKQSTSNEVTKGTPCPFSGVPASPVQPSITVLPTILNPTVNNSRPVPFTLVVTPHGVVPVQLQALGFPAQVPAPASLITNGAINLETSSGQATNVQNTAVTPPTTNDGVREVVSATEANPESNQDETTSTVAQKPSIASNDQNQGPLKSTTQSILTSKKYPVVKIARLLPSGLPKQGAAAAGTQAQPSSPSPSPAAAAEKKVMDWGLVSLEEEGVAKNWFHGIEGVKVPMLPKGMAYLPPSACTLKTLSKLLLQTSTLEENAFKLVPSMEGESEPTPAEKTAILRGLVDRKLKSNPGYLLLKQRFLSAFTVPGFLASLHPEQTKKVVSNITIKSEDSDDETDDSADEEPSPYNEPHPTASYPQPSACTEPEGAPENPYSQMTSDYTDDSNIIARRTRKRTYNYT
ncbi:snRNA-activating protein complex subunit 4-like isoform X2 [Xenopus laevis]|uniref:snRNA-activating protein complex subunit 4-like isoform X2 n=1 Tax=Xenopus laevis TaxID=8355 RepID=A0A8J1LGW8_XENLA|nr:snRNA-activating protein complex subunit 4-like isoform X2 [Xenopus laevis]